MAVPKSTEIKPDHLYRFAEVDTDSADAEDMTVQVSFSSETPVLRKAGASEEELGIAKKGEKYLEVLSHEKGDADFSDLNRAGAPLLDEHKNAVQLGNVKRARLSKDKRGRAVLKFDGVTDLSKTRFQQMKEGTRPFVSFGYVHTRFIGDTELPDGRKAKRIAFAADEISSVAKPADTTIGARRSAAGQWACLGCGEMFDAASLDENFECELCRCSNRQQSNQPMKERTAIRDLTNIFTRAESGKISFSNLRDWVTTSAKSDPRFNKNAKGETTEWVWVADIEVEEVGVQDGKDVDNYKAVIQAADGKYYEVAFTFSEGKAVLGKELLVIPVTKYEPVARSAAAAEKTRSATPPVDSPKFTTADESAPNILTKKPMANELDEKQIRADQEKLTRQAVLGEVTEKAKTRTNKVMEARKEIRALADSYVKDSGANWAGKPGEIVVVGERIRAFEQAAYDALEQDSGESFSAIRNTFKTDCGELIRSSRAPKNQQEVAHLDNSIAQRCSLGRVIREGMKAAEQNQRSSCFMIQDGAEKEAHDEIHHRAQEFPGGAASLAEGVQLPWNMPSGVRSNTPVGRLKRDALAGDFATAGALVAPEYIFPTIELLRNLPALARAGMTILSGVMGNLVLPRQESPTTAQSIAEGGALTQYDQVLGQIKMSPHRVGSSQKYSRLALLQTTPDFEAMVMADHMAVLALKIDYLGLNGQGAGDEPLGILNQLIPTVLFSGSAANAFKNAVAMETAVRKTNIYEPGAYITTSTSRGTLMSTAKLLTGATVVAATPVWDNETVAGRPAWDSQQVPGDVMVYLVGRHLVMAQWGGLAVVLDTLSQANQDKYWLNINTYVDFALRHNSAVCRSADSLASLS